MMRSEGYIGADTVLQGQLSGNIMLVLDLHERRITSASSRRALSRLHLLILLVNLDHVYDTGVDGHFNYIVPFRVFVDFAVQTVQ